MLDLRMTLTMADERVKPCGVFSELHICFLHLSHKSAKWNKRCFHDLKANPWSEVTITREGNLSLLSQISFKRETIKYKGQEQKVFLEAAMAAEQQILEQQQAQMLKMKNFGAISYNSSPNEDDKAEEISRSVLSKFRAKEEEIEKKKMEVKERVQAQLGRVEEETKRLAEIREELEALQDPMRKEVAFIRKRIDSVNRELKPLGFTCQKREREYKEALETFNEKSREKAQLVAKLMELINESEKLRMKKLEDLSKNIESLH
ncbi:hypothetical protein Nepgr_012959 [Nepenthes gracilis]|uniref:RAB6-interacting golgin n=1 Tax=Nepenthes gracilis TaxID=150966 RepID=A0AAD3SH15_NEPGR|nr:hypothetical protein Nepgr_012959 [Nepenthes gracilis]